MAAGDGQERADRAGGGLGEVRLVTGGVDGVGRELREGWGLVGAAAFVLARVFFPILTYALDTILNVKRDLYIHQ